MLSFSSSKEMLKYTLGLAGVGFAYAQTRLGVTTRIFSRGDEICGLPLAQWVLAALLALFFLSTLAAIAAFMGIIRQENEDAGHEARESTTTLSVDRGNDGTVVLTVATQAAPDPVEADRTYETGRTTRIDKVKTWSNRHLVLLLLGYGVALVFFLGEATNPPITHDTCTLKLPIGEKKAVLDFDCGASLESILKGAKLRAETE